MIEKYKSKLTKIFKKNQVVLAYLFGSAVKGKMSSLSDFDFGVLFGKRVKKREYFDKNLKIGTEISLLLKTDKVDVVTLNTAPPLLKHRVVFSGTPLFVSNQKLKRIFELRVLQEFEDFNYHLETAFKAMEKQIKEGTFGKPLKSILK